MPRFKFTLRTLFVVVVICLGSFVVAYATRPEPDWHAMRGDIARCDDCGWFKFVSLKEILAAGDNWIWMPYKCPACGGKCRHGTRYTGRKFIFWLEPFDLYFPDPPIMGPTK